MYSEVVSIKRNKVLITNSDVYSRIAISNTLEGNENDSRN